jgi:hypothetical protein
MLCRKLKQTLYLRSAFSKSVHYNLLKTSRFLSKKCYTFDSILTTFSNSETRLGMSSFRLVINNFSVLKLWCVWTRSSILNTVVKRCKRDRGVREIFHLFRQTIFHPKRAFLLSVTAAFEARSNGGEKPPSCGQSITDQDLEVRLFNHLCVSREMGKINHFYPL